MDPHAPFALIAGSYGDQDGAVADFAAIWAGRQDGEFHHTSIAVLARDTDGALRVARRNSTAKHILWGGALLGAPLFVVAPVAGAEVLATTGLSGAGVIAEHLHLNADPAQLAEATALLDDGLAGLVVVVLNRASSAVTRLLLHADRTIAIDMSWGDLEEELAEEPAWREPPVVLVAR